MYVHLCVWLPSETQRQSGDSQWVRRWQPTPALAIGLRLKLSTTSRIVSFLTGLVAQYYSAIQTNIWFMQAYWRVVETDTVYEWTIYKKNTGQLGTSDPYTSKYFLNIIKCYRFFITFLVHRYNGGASKPFWDQNKSNILNKLSGNSSKIKS